YTANRNRYMVPEQRVLRIAPIGPDQVSNVTASDQEITAYYNAHQADYAAKETRDVSQALVQDQATATAIAAKVKGGASIAAAAGSNAAVTSLKDQSQAAYNSVVGAKAAAEVFAAPSGSVIGPVQTSFGWAVVKVDSVKTQGGKSPEQARSEIAATITADKRKNAVEDVVDKLQDSIDNNGLNFTEAAQRAKLPVTTTPLIIAYGTSRSDPSFKSLPDNKGYAMVSPGQVVPAAPAPLASVHDQVANDWINAKAMDRARQVAAQIEAKVEHGIPLAQAMKESGAPLPPVQPLAARRIQIATAQGPVPPVLKMLFSLGEGKSRMFADPQGRGYFIVDVKKIVPGNAMLQPALIGQMQNQLQQGVSDDYAREFLTAIRKEVGTDRNESAIQAMKTRMVSSGG